MIQLPNDAISVGYRETAPFQWEQIFSSQAAGFTGTEREFVQRGYGYEYFEIGQFIRRVRP